MIASKMQSREGEKKNDAKRVRRLERFQRIENLVQKDEIPVVKGSSAYAQRMNSAGREIFGCEIDVELADAVRQVAANEGIKVSLLLKREWAKLVNANGIAYTAKDPASKLSQAELEIQRLKAELEALQAKV